MPTGSLRATGLAVTGSPKVWGPALIFVSILTIVRQARMLDEYGINVVVHSNTSETTSSVATATTGLERAAPHAAPRFVAPNESNTVVALIAMGKVSNTYLAERAVRSLRASGAFGGWVAVLTDPRGHRKYHDTLLPWDPRTIVLRGHEEDLRAQHRKKKWGNANMPYKRFKTLLFKYLDSDERVASNSSRHVLYLDIDTVCTNELATFFKNYHEFVTSEYERQLTKGLARNASFELSFLSAYRDPGTSGDFVHSGLMVFDRHFAGKCLDRWRWMFDNVGATIDQVLLKYTVEDVERCVPFMLDGMNKSHYQLFNPFSTNGWEDSKPTFVHITSPRARLKKVQQTELLQKALKLEDPQKEILFDKTTWKEALIPVQLH